MMHLSSEKVYRLAQLVTREMGFREEDVADMHHIGACEQCYRRLCSAMALMDVVENPECAVLEQTVRNTVAKPEKKRRALIRLTVGRNGAALEACEEETEAWPFRVPLRMGRVQFGGAVAKCPSPAAEDGNSGSCVAFEEETGVLVIRLEAGCGEKPRAYLAREDGSEEQIYLEKNDGQYQARVPGLNAGTYRIILEK